MIKLNKGVEPQVLRDNKDEWTRQLLCYVKKGEGIPKSLSSNYASSDVKAALQSECKNKCMYCESIVSHVAYEHIEHIKPKARDKFPELTFEWQNLGLACPVCNINKGSDFDVTMPFVNPYVDDPSQFFVALGNFVHNKQANPRSELTSRRLGLNRPELIERRMERLEAITRLIERYHAQRNLSLKEAILDEIKVEISEDKPYSLCAKSLYDALI